MRRSRSCRHHMALSSPHPSYLVYHYFFSVRRVETEEGVACAPWWLSMIIGVHDPIQSGSQVAQHGDIDDGKPCCDLTSHQSAEHPTPVDNPPPPSVSFDPVRPLSFIAKGREMIAWWTSCALLCALLFLLLSAYAFNGKVATSLLSSARSVHSSSPCTPCNLHLAPLPHSPLAPWVPHHGRAVPKGERRAEGQSAFARGVRLNLLAPLARRPLG